MYKGVAKIEEGRRTYEVQTKLCNSIREVVAEVAKLGRNGRIATCDVWIKAIKTWTRIQSVVLD